MATEIVGPLSANGATDRKHGFGMGRLDWESGYAVPVKDAQWAVRRLTPLECEKLQGFPPGYTRIPWRGKLAEECPDGPRYRCLGNSWAVPVVRWIAERIDLELRRSEQTPDDNSS